jgi:hypothetical protein
MSPPVECSNSDARPAVKRDEVLRDTQRMGAQLNRFASGALSEPMIVFPLRFGQRDEQMIELEPTTWRSEAFWFVAALLAMSVISFLTLNAFPG